MAKIIVVTNFSNSSRNALEYACKFLHNPTTSVLLLNIFSFPGSMSYDGVAIAAMAETIADDERKLQQEFEWVKANYPEINIKSEMVTGVFQDELKQKVAEEETKLIVMGASGKYNELLSWDSNIVDTFIDLDIPVLIVPATTDYKPIERIAFAVNYHRKNLQMPAMIIRKLVSFTKAKLFIINVVAPSEVIDEEALKSKQLFLENMNDLSPVYFEPEFNNIFTAIDQFTAKENIDLLLVIPARHGLWHNLFQSSNSKKLVYLNHIPVLSLRQGTDFL